MKASADRQEKALSEFAALTDAIKANLRANEQLARKRREVALRLHGDGYTYKQLATSAGLSEVYIYKILKGPQVVKRKEKQTAIAKKARAALNLPK